jgi:hypothetical protein
MYVRERVQRYNVEPRISEWQNFKVGITENDEFIYPLTFPAPPAPLGFGTPRGLAISNISQVSLVG